jgi:hypothetical protein
MSFVSNRLGSVGQIICLHTPCHVPAPLGVGIDTLAGASHACATFTKRVYSERWGKSGRRSEREREGKRRSERERAGEKEKE